MTNTENTHNTQDNAETLAKAVEAFNKVAEAAKKILNSVFETIKRIAEVTMPYYREAWALYKEYPNKRVKHLAAHGSPRTRKKNINRIARWIIRRGNMPRDLTPFISAVIARI